MGLLNLWLPTRKLLIIPLQPFQSFNDETLEVLEELVSGRKKRRQSRPKMHRMRRLLWKRLAKGGKAIKTASSIHKLGDLLQKMWDLESQLSSDYTADSNREEYEAVLRQAKAKKKAKCWSLSGQ